MTQDTLGRAAVTALALVLLGWLGVSLYTRPLSASREAEPVRRFLARALAGDSAGLVPLAAAPEPVAWALAAVREDSTMVRLWATNVGRVKRMQRGDTVWITLSQNRSTPHCSFLGTLSAALVGTPESPRLAHLSASCPEVAAGTDRSGR